MSLFAELRRRNVFKVGAAYLVSAWLLIQFADILLDNMQAPAWVLQAVMVLLVIGFFITAFVAWAFELTPEGLKREHEIDRSQSITRQTGRKLDFVIIGMLVLVAAYFIWESRFAGEKGSEPLGDLGSESNLREAAPGRESGSEDLTLTPNLPDPFSGARENSIAVLPFTNRSPDANDAYFTDGIHDDLLTQLAKIDAFSVISRTSVMEYRDTAKNLKQIASELGVANVMEGAVQRAGNRVRINVQLIDAGTDEHLWAEVYDRELSTENLFDIQSEIAQAIATALKATLSDSELAEVSDIPTQSVEAYELYLQGLQYGTDANPEELDTGIALLQAAIDIDPEFALAWTGMSYALVSKYWLTGNMQSREQARTAIDQARNLNPDLPELLKAEAGYLYWGYLDYENALAWIEQALARMPNDAEAHMLKGWASRRAGHWEQALTSMQTALQLDPRQAYNWHEIGTTYFYLHRFAEGRAALLKGRALDPADYWAKSALAQLVLAESGDLEQALRLTAGAQHSGLSYARQIHLDTRLIARDFEAALAASEAWPEEHELTRISINLREAQVARVLYQSGQVDAARELASKAQLRLESLRASLGADDYRPIQQEVLISSLLGEQQRLREVVAEAERRAPNDAVEAFTRRYDYAQCYGMAGMTSEAIGLLQVLLPGPSNVSAIVVRLDPAFDGIRNEPDFVAMLEQYP